MTGGDTDYQGAEIGASESALYQIDGYNMLTLPYLWHAYISGMQLITSRDSKVSLDKAKNTERQVPSGRLCIAVTAND